MLTIRMQRTGRKGLAHFRIVVQDARFSPTSGRVVAQIGHYNPHTKELVLDKKLAQQYLSNGAQPSERVVSLLQKEKVSLPDWVKLPSADKKRATRNPQKLRKNQPKEPAAEPEPVADAAPAESEPTAEEEAKPEAEVETETETPAAEETAEEKAE